MRYGLVILIFLLCSDFYAIAGEIVLRQLGFATELLIKTENVRMETYKYDKNRLTLVFEKSLTLGVSKDIDDKLFKKVYSIGKNLFLEFSADAIVEVISSDLTVRILASKKKTVDNVNIKNIIEDPKKIKTGQIRKDPLAEQALADIKNMASAGDYDNAILKINDFLLKHPKDLYGQEAYFLLGDIYLKLGEVSPKNYIQASSIFEDFAKKYSDSYLYLDALWNSAVAKEKAGLYYEAVFEYRNIISAMEDTEIARKSYEKIGTIYETIGQYDKAIEGYREMLSKTNKKDFKIISRIGMLYNQLNDLNSAYEYFAKIIDEDPDYGELGEDVLFAMADVLNKKEFFDRAIKIYSKIYNIFPEGKYADIAMYNSALILEKQGKNQLADKIFIDAKEKFPQKNGGLLSTLNYAKKYMADHNTDYWLDFLRDTINTITDLNIRGEAFVIIINSFTREKLYDEALGYIKMFEQTFFDSPFLSEVYDIKQKINLESAREAFLKGDFNSARNILSKILTEFPDTKYQDEMNRILEDIRYSEIELLVENKQYIDAIKGAEIFFASAGKIYEPERWNKLLDDSYKNYIILSDLDKNTQSVIIYAKQYFINIPKGKHTEEVKKIFEKNLLSLFNKSVKDGDYIEVINIYQNNIQWVDMFDENTKDSVFSYVAYALHSLGEFDKGKEIIKKVKGVKNPDIYVIKTLFGEDTGNYDINILNEEKLTFLTRELKVINPLKGYELLKKYIKDEILSLKLRGSIVPAKLKNAELLKKYYNEILTVDFDSRISDILIAGGKYYFSGKDYDNAEKFFKKVISESSEKELQASAKYFLGKIAIEKNSEDIALKYFEDIKDNYKDSAYYKRALKEFGDLSWKKKLKTE